MEVHVAVYRDQIACIQPVASVRQHSASQLGSRACYWLSIKTCQQQVTGHIQEVCRPQRNTCGSALPATWKGVYLDTPDPILGGR